MHAAKEMSKERKELAKGICGENVTSWKRKLINELDNIGEFSATPIQGVRKKKEITDTAWEGERGLDYVPKSQVAEKQNGTVRVAAAKQPYHRNKDHKLELPRA